MAKRREKCCKRGHTFYDCSFPPNLPHPTPSSPHIQAITKIRDFLLQKVYLLKRPKTNLQIIQQSSLLKYKYFIQFLRQHGPDLFIEVRAGDRCGTI